MQDTIKKQTAMMAKFMEKEQAPENEMVVTTKTHDHDTRSNEKKKKQKR